MRSVIVCAFLFVLGAFGLLPAAGAQVYGPQVKEFNFSIRSYFHSAGANRADWTADAESQLSHLFGVFHSPRLIREFGLNPGLVGGIGAIQFPLRIQVESTVPAGAGRFEVRYRATGKALMQSKVAEMIEGGKTLSVPLPIVLDQYYDENCTDEHYNSFGDFWYFFDPFKRGCEYLGRPPYADQFVIELSPATKRKLDLDMRLDLLRGDNGNGRLFRIDVIHGFEDSADSDEDAGRANYEEFHDYLISQGFDRQVLQRFKNRPLVRFTKTIRLANGRLMDVEINSRLVETSIAARAVTFAKTLKEAFAHADVVIYAGHSGLGGNLDIPSLEKKAGGFEFNANKRQIFFFDSCSSYSYYLDSFRAEKTRARLDVVTNGLPSYFHTGLAVLASFLNDLLDPTVEDKGWPETLGNIERQLNGGSYLINVGGI